jgi:hypothetical protein
LKSTERAKATAMSGMRWESVGSSRCGGGGMCRLIGGYCLGKEKATRRWLGGEVEAGYLRAYTAQVQMPAQTAVEMIQVQPLTVMRLMRRTMPASTGGTLTQITRERECAESR